MPVEKRRERAEHPHDVVRSDDRLRERRALASAVRDGLHVGREQLLQPVDVALAQRVEEPRRQLLPLAAIGGEPRPPLLDVPAGSDDELTAGRLGTIHGHGDLRELEPEHVTQHEHGTFERTQPLEQHEGGHRDGVGQLGGPLGILVRIRHERLGEPRPDIRLPPHARRAQHVDRDAGDHGREERLHGCRLGLGRRVSEPGLLHGVLRLAHAAEDPVGDGEEQRAKVIELLDSRHPARSVLR